MRTVTIEVSRDVDAPAQDAWAVFADYARDHEWREGVQMRQEPEGLAVPGAMTYERLVLLGSESRVVARIEEVEPGRRLSFRAIESDVPVRGERRVETKSEGKSRVTLRLEMSPSGLWAVIARPVTFFFRRRVARDLDRLAALVAGQRGSPR